MSGSVTGPLQLDETASPAAEYGNQANVQQELDSSQEYQYISINDDAGEARLHYGYICESKDALCSLRQPPDIPPWYGIP